MRGQTNMENRIKDDLFNRSLDLRKKVKDLQEIMFGLYNFKTKENNNIFIYIKRNIDKLSTINRCISSLDMSGIAETEETVEDKELINIFKDTTENIKKLYSAMDKKVSEELRKGSSKEITSFKRNLDNLRLAYSTIKTIDLDLGLKQKDWDMFRE